MSDIEKLVESYFAPKKNLLSRENLWRLFEEVISEQEVDASETEDINISFPKILS